MTKEGYSPYCGLDAKCPFHWPRTKFNGKQFVCACGWTSDFPEDFINRYKEKWNL